MIVLISLVADVGHSLKVDRDNSGVVDVPATKHIRLNKFLVRR
jgi:hypothetical protein